MSLSAFPARSLPGNATVPRVGDSLRFLNECLSHSLMVINCCAAALVQYYAHFGLTVQLRKVHARRPDATPGPVTMMQPAALHQSAEQGSETRLVVQGLRAEWRFRRREG